MMTAAGCVVALALCGGPVMAQSLSNAASNAATAAGGFPLPLIPPSPTTVTPQFYVKPPVALPPEGCAAAFDCRVRVLGAIQRNGAVELNAAILKW